MNNEHLLDEVIGERLKGLKTMQEGSEQFDKEVSGLSKLMNQRNEMEKIKNERIKLDNEYASISVENDRVQSEKAERKSKVIMAGITTAIGVGIWYASMILEEHGSFTSDTSRKIYNQIFRIKQS